MARKPKQYEDDDGRTIVDMDIEGMKWHDRRVRRDKREEKSSANKHKYQMTKSEALRYTFYAVLAGLLIVLVFSVVWILFTLFATQILFR